MTTYSDSHRWQDYTFQAPIKFAMLALLAIALNWPALWNGFPLLYFDTAWYALDAHRGLVPQEKALAYPFLMAAASSIYPSLWLVIIFQSILVVYLLWQLLLVLGISSFWQKWVIILALAFLTPLSWISAHVMPDIFFCLSGAAFFTLLLHPQRGTHFILIAIIFLFSMMMHSSNLPIIVTISFLLGLGLFFLSASQRLSRWNIFILLGMICCTAPLMIALNYSRTGEIYLFRGGEVLLANRLIEDGLMQRFLDKHCDDNAYELCVHRWGLQRQRGHFLYDPQSPLMSIGGWSDSGPALRKIIFDSFLDQPNAHIYKILSLTLDQLLSFDIANFIFSFTLDDPVSTAIAMFYPQDLERYWSSNQQTNHLPSPLVGSLHRVVVGLSLLIVCIVGFTLKSPARDRLRGFLVYSLSLVLVNALFLGAISHPEPRYQARVIWLLPLAAIVVSIEKWREHNQRRPL